MNKYLLFFTLISLLSCSDGNLEDVKKVTSSPRDKETLKESLNISPSMKKIFGVWRIDSVAENLKYNVLLIDTEKEFEAFHFRGDGVFSMLKKTERIITDQDQGSYVATADSVFILNDKNEPIMKYGYEHHGNNLILNGNFPISTGNNAKPSFFLSKVNERDL